jgi:hypothetical protein
MGAAPAGFEASGPGAYLEGEQVSRAAGVEAEPGELAGRAAARDAAGNDRAGGPVVDAGPAAGDATDAAHRRAP